MAVAPNKVYRLFKLLYGLKQAWRQWFDMLVNELQCQHFQHSKFHYSLFYKKTGDLFTFLVIYVDDILITSNNPLVIPALKQHLDHVFSIKDLGDLHYFLGIEVSRASDHIILTQEKFTKKLLQSSVYIDFKPAITPLTSQFWLKLDGGPLLLLIALFTGAWLVNLTS